jgi:hypothetical protein
MRFTLEALLCLGLFLTGLTCLDMLLCSYYMKGFLCVIGVVATWVPLYLYLDKLYHKSLTEKT